MHRWVQRVDNVFSSLTTATAAIEAETRRVTVVINLVKAAISRVDGQVQMLDETCLDSRPVTEIDLSIATWCLIRMQRVQILDGELYQPSSPGDFPARRSCPQITAALSMSHETQERSPRRWIIGGGVSRCSTHPREPLVNHEVGSLSLVSVRRSPHWESIWAATWRGLHPPGRRTRGLPCRSQ